MSGESSQGILIQLFNILVKKKKSVQVLHLAWKCGDETPCVTYAAESAQERHQ